jgi:hypothetical protein
MGLWERVFWPKTRQKSKAQPLLPENLAPPDFINFFNFPDGV